MIASPSVIKMLSSQVSGSPVSSGTRLAAGKSNVYFFPTITFINPQKVFLRGTQNFPVSPYIPGYALSFPQFLLYKPKEMEFEALYFGDRLTVVNPRGVIGVVTLWSKPEYVLERFREAGVDLDPATSPIAVFGTLYGNGLREMLRNLLYNPQIQVLLICGHDRSGSKQELINFFEHGLMQLESSLVKYEDFEGHRKVVPCRIHGTKRIMDDMVQKDHFAAQPILNYLGDPKEEEVIYSIRHFFNNWTPPQVILDLSRLKIPLPKVKVDYFPSNLLAHQVIQDSAIDAWIDLIFLLIRFGKRVTLKKGDRLELQNVKVIVNKPEFEQKKIKKFNLDSKKLRLYQKDILKVNKKIDKEIFAVQKPLIPTIQLRPDETYNYGHRLRAHFQIDGLAEFVTRLKDDLEDRKSYFTLWDNKRDLKTKSGQPCFVSLFFRKCENLLTMTSTFRTHNALDGWLLNFYGLMAIQELVADKVGLPIGPITVISHSISIDPKELDRALTVVGKRKWKMSLDPMGYFRVTVDGDELLVEHRAEDVTLKEYRGRTAVALQHQIARDAAVSDLNHAMYLGRQLAKAEMALKEGREFVQD
jgi:thymidylate synthase